ncbi:MAG: hypothetical protein CMF42_04815 [Legionellales bacterium]|nr:hypothetical protein [Legionellales bacterium]OUX67340.1 MAG: hypothetical protein CBD38_03005 [bacterium TMED178]
MKNKISVIALLITVVIDIMGIGLVFPVLPELFSPSGNHFQLSSYYLYQGLCITMMIVPMGWTLCGLFIGYFADRYGRKVMILMSLIVSVFSYLLCIYAINIHSLSLFLAARMLIGIAGGCYCLVQTVMSDIATTEELPTYVSWVNCASAIGFVIGALITSLSSYKGIANDVTLPFYIGALLSLFGAVMIHVFFHESFQPNSDNTHNVIQAIIELFKLRTTRNLLISFFLIEIAWGIYLQASPIILSNNYHYSTNLIAIFYLGYGLCAATAILLLQPLFEKYFDYQTSIPWLSWIVKIAIFMTFFLASHIMNAVGMIVATFAEFLLFTGVLVMISTNSGNISRGQTMGLVSTVIGASFLFSDLLIYLLESVDSIYSLLIVALLFPGFYLLKPQSSEAVATST